MEKAFNNYAARAGLIPWREVNGSVLFFVRKSSDPKFGGPDWQIAKGVIDPGETAKEAALREGHEELGVTLESIDLTTLVQLPTIRMTKYQYTVESYSVCVTDLTKLVDPHYETGDTTWMEYDVFLRIGRTDNRIIIQHAYERIKNGQQI